MAQDGLDRLVDSLEESLRGPRKLIGEFKAFILRGNALDLAVGVVIGAAFNTVVQSLVKYILTPIISIPGNVDFKKLDACLRSGPGTGGAPVCKVTFGYGIVLTDLISFLLTAAAVFFFVVRPMNKLREWRKGSEAEGPAMRDCPECLSKVPAGARRCAFCTAKIGAAA